MQKPVGSSIETAYDLYSSGSLHEVKAVCAEILRQQPENFEALYLDGLAACYLGDIETGARRIKEAGYAFPHIESFCHMDGVLRHQGINDDVAIWERRLVEFKMFSTTDVFVISYPKCGRTWARLVLGKYALNGRDADPLEVYRITEAELGLATVYFKHDDFPHYKPYTAIHRDKSMYKDKKVVFLVRDPRDILVSYYFQYTLRGDKKMANDSNFNGTLSDFIRHHIGGLRNIVGFFNAWAQQQDVPERFFLLRYENLHADPLGEYQRLIDFLQWPNHGQEALTAAVSFGDFDNMKKLEREDTFNNLRLKPPEDGNPEGFKVRRGKVGGYVDYFSDDDINFVEDFLRRELDDFYAFYKSAP